MKRFIQGAAIITTPEVPRYDSGRIEPTQGFNTPRAQGLGPEAFGAGIGQGLQQSSKTMFAVASEERAKADRTATIQARTALDQAEVDLLYHPQTGALAKRGKDAFSLEEPTLKSFDEKTAEIEGGLLLLNKNPPSSFWRDSAASRSISRYSGTFSARSRPMPMKRIRRVCNQHLRTLSAITKIPRGSNRSASSGWPSSCPILTTRASLLKSSRRK